MPRALCFTRTDREPRKELWDSGSMGMDHKAEMNKYLTPSSKGSVCVHKTQLWSTEIRSSD